ncbi:MAG: hypothetical protein ACRDOJ_12350 [Nocardioidaceae bacterium]
MAADDSTHEQTGRRRTARTNRQLPYPVAAGAVGLLLAVLARVLIFAGERGCDAVRGTATCGTAGGFMLLVIVGLMIYLGIRLLRLLQVPEPGVTSALGVSLLAIVILTVLLDSIFSAWMWLVLPLVAAVVYAVSAWTATKLSETGG